jgi:hypothetical protein
MLNKFRGRTFWRVNVVGLKDACGTVKLSISKLFKGLTNRQPFKKGSEFFVRNVSPGMLNLGEHEARLLFCWVIYLLVCRCQFPTLLP